MLATQVQYWTLQETKRHNLVAEDQGYKNLNEMIRHNTVTEGETNRHNVATEQETQRHNIATEAYYNNALGETTRHNLATEALTSEQNQISLMNAFANQRNAAANEMNAATNAKNARTREVEVANSYSLGLDANRIAQENADTRAQEAQTAWYDTFVNRDTQAEASYKQAEAATQNAATNLMNANTRQEELELGYKNLALNLKRLGLDTGKTISGETRSWIQTGSDVADTWFDNVLLKNPNVGMYLK